MDNAPYIYKILLPSEWEQFQKNKVFTGSTFDKESGFIHCSTHEQISRILNKFFSATRPVYLLTIEKGKLLEAKLVFEANKPGGEEYPHLYGSIPLAAVIKIEKIIS